jgi:hypothetical protein
LCRAYADFERHHNVVKALDIPPVGVPAPDRPPQVQLAATRSECIEAIERPSSSLDFSECLLPTYRVAEATSVAVPDRPLTPRGFTAAFSGSQTDTKLSLQFANEFKLRTPLAGAGQRYATWGFSTGVPVDGGTIGDLDDDGKRNNKRFDEDIDRLGAKAKVTGSLSLNFYPEEESDAWQARAAKVHDEAYKACLKDRASTSSSPGCTGEELRSWLVETKEDGSYKHKAEAEAYSNLYFGPAARDERPLGVAAERRVRASVIHVQASGSGGDRAPDVVVARRVDLPAARSYGRIRSHRCGVADLQEAVAGLFCLE